MQLSRHHQMGSIKSIFIVSSYAPVEKLYDVIEGQALSSKLLPVFTVPQVFDHANMYKVLTVGIFEDISRV